MRRRLAALATVASLLVSACSSVPTSTPGPARSPGGSGAPASPSDGPALAQRLHDGVDVDRIVADLRSLERLTVAAGGSRPAGSRGEAAAIDFVAGELEAAGLRVTRHEVSLPVFRETGPSTLQVLSSSQAFQPGSDFKALLFSPPGDVTARVIALGFDPRAAPGSTGGAGCRVEDWAGFPAGSIALLQPGACLAREVVERAQAAGAVAVVRSYPGWSAGRVLRPTLIEPAGLRIPVVGTTHAAGVSIAEAARLGRRVRVAVRSETTMGRTVNLLAETSAGDPAHVVMLGAHLDSVLDGPGVNDDGSGAMAVLEIGRGLAAAARAGTSATWRVRLAFWAGEEIGMWGSMAWFRSLDPTARGTIEAYLNLDMLGSRNGVRQVYAWSAAGDASAAPLEQLLGRSLELDGLTWESAPAGRSDDLAFAEAGIPTSGLFSGDSAVMSGEQASRFGGIAGQPFDPCYHLSCDTVANVDRVLLAQLARAAAWTIGDLAGGSATAAG